MYPALTLNYCVMFKFLYVSTFFSSTSFGDDIYVRGIIYMHLWYFIMIMVHGYLYYFFTICLDKHYFLSLLCNVVG